MVATWKQRFSQIKPEYLWWFWVAAGVVLRLRQYVANRSFWHDEACLALNLVQRSFAGLTRPLDYEQGAPIVFLFIEKAIMSVLGNRDFILRLFPLAAGLIALVLLYRIAKGQFGWPGMFAVALFAISTMPVYYASELKQYSSDMMLALLLIALALPLLEERVRKRDVLILGGVGAVAIWVSHPAAFVLAGVGIILAIDRLLRKDYRSLAWLIGMGGIWFLSLGVEYIVSLRHLSADSYLQFYWRKSFMPFPPWTDKGWFVKTYYSFLLMSLGRTDWFLTLLFPCLILIGAVSLFFRKYRVALMIVLPFFMVAFASILKEYPLKDRFMLFLVPPGLLLLAEGLGAIHRLLARWDQTAALLGYALVALVIFWLPASTTLQMFIRPNMGQDIKPVMVYVEENLLPGDTVYVYHGSMPAFDYYAPFYGLDSGNVVVAAFQTDNRIALQNFYADVSGLRGKGRVWFIFSHIVDCGGCKGDPKAFYLDYLDGLGSKLAEVHAPGADGYLYNLTR